jgi:hypothetical protein
LLLSLRDYRGTGLRAGRLARVHRARLARIVRSAWAPGFGLTPLPQPV